MECLNCRAYFCMVYCLGGGVTSIFFLFYLGLFSCSVPGRKANLKIHLLVCVYSTFSPSFFNYLFISSPTCLFTFLLFLRIPCQGHACTVPGTPMGGGMMYPESVLWKSSDVMIYLTDPVFGSAGV